MTQGYADHRSTSTVISDREAVEELFEEYQPTTLRHIEEYNGDLKLSCEQSTTFGTEGKTDREREFFGELTEYIEEPFVVRSYYDPPGQDMVQAFQWVAMPDGEVRYESLSLPQ